MEGVAGQGDNALMRRTGRSALPQGLLALAVMAAGVVVVATDDSTPVARAETTLGTFHDVKIVSAAGVVREAFVGQQLVNGDIITTGRHGAADLITRNRVTMLGRSAALVVKNGGLQQLRTGTAVIDALRGPGINLDISGNIVSIPHGSGTEAIRGVSVRVGALAGPAQITSPSGRRLALPALSQAVLSGDALPGATTPLHLTDSVEEGRVAHRLVNDDLALKTLARGIDTTGRSTARIIAASWSGTTQPVPNRVRRSERVLPVLIADATRGGSAQQRYNNAVSWRAQGGSWGVVLHLLSGRATAVESRLAEIQRAGQEPGQIGTVSPPAVVAAGPSGPTAFETPSVGGGPTHFPTSTPPKVTPPGTPTVTPTPTNLLGSLVSTVQSVLDGVLNLLPHEKAVEKPAKQRKTTADTPLAGLTHKAATKATTVIDSPAKTTRTTPPVTETPASNGLLGDVLGGLLGKH
jgi:hypothetical protein